MTHQEHPADQLIADAMRASEPKGTHDLDSVPFPDFVDAVHAAIPAARDHARDLRLPDDIVEATLLDIDRKVLTYGDDGIRSWLVEVLRFDVLQIGRLQFERATTAHGRAIHIPELGPIDPESIDTAIRRADAFFGPAQYSCESWMLHPAITSLSEASNIRRFRDRFDITHTDVGPLDADGAASGDHAVCKFVFRQPYTVVARLDRTTRRSSLERLILTEFDAGRHWTESLGILQA